MAVGIIGAIARQVLASGVRTLKILSGGTLEVDGTLDLSNATLSPTGAEVALGYINLRQEESSGTNVGLSSGAWRTVDLNVEPTDTGSHCTLDTVTNPGRFTLAEGTYRVRAWTVSGNVGNWQTRLQNITDATTAIVGASVWHEGSERAQTASFVEGQFSVGSGGKAFEFQRRSSLTNASTGGGRSASLGTEVYASVEIWKVA